MVEVNPNLFIGDQADYETEVRGRIGWRVVHACKEPYHRQELGYRTRGAPTNHPEYLIARRGDRLILNLVDADDPAYIPKEIIDAALAFVEEALAARHRVLVHCNLGQSRSAAIGLLYLATRTERIPSTSLREAETEFMKIYPMYNPKPGVRGFLARYWEQYCGSSQVER